MTGCGGGVPAATRFASTSASSSSTTASGLSAATGADASAGGPRAGCWPAARAAEVQAQPASYTAQPLTPLTPLTRLKALLLPARDRGVSGGDSWPGGGMARRPKRVEAPHAATTRVARGQSRAMRRC